jgi:type II secretory pathway component GspD/PulD (secretin)
VHSQAEVLAEALSQVLQSEGIEARTNAVGSAVTLVALTESRALVVFATRPDLLEHTTAWVQLLDAEAGHQSEGVFSHALSHITATRAVEVLSALVSPDTPLVADPTRNAVVFRGPPAQWRLLLAQLPAMDLPSATVMVEVLVLELSLESRFESGLDWLVSRRIGGEEFSVGTSGLSSGEAGFNLLLRDGNTVRAALALFAGDARVAIRSRPRLAPRVLRYHGDGGGHAVACACERAGCPAA